MIRYNPIDHGYGFSKAKGVGHTYTPSGGLRLVQGLLPLPQGVLKRLQSNYLRAPELKPMERRRFRQKYCGCIHYIKPPSICKICRRVHAVALQNTSWRRKIR